MIKNRICSLLAGISAITFTYACSTVETDQSDKINALENVESAPKQSEVLLWDFEDGSIPPEINGGNATLVIKEIDGNNVLAAELHGKENTYSGIAVRAPQSWDWSEHESLGIAFDIGNPGDHSTQLFFNAADANGNSFTRSVVIPKGDAKTYFVDLKSADIDLDSGLRDNPSALASDATKFIWMWGTEQLNLSKITQFGVNTDSLLHDRNITIDNIRLIANAETDPLYLSNIVDKYGQSAKTEYSFKIHSDEALVDKMEEELASLKDSKMKDRSKYGGWLNGPKLDGTGYFRTEKVDGKWALVDPEGYLFFSTGIANIRMSNTSTMTGMDFPQELLVQPDKDDVTPEDSKGLNRAPNSAVPGRFIASELRSNMFTWLPDYEDELSDHYGYRRGAHTGPLKQGETFSFYRANLERKYGEATPQSYMDNWRQVTIDRMLDWGFTSFGNWVDPSFYQNNRYPYFANGWIIGDFKTVSSGDDFWSPLPDPFDPEFVKRANITAEVIAEEVKGNEWCIGVFIDNEKSWGRMGSPEGQYGIVINTLSRQDSESPTKAEFTRLLKEKYSSIAAFNEAWSLELASWDDLSSGIELNSHSTARQSDYAILLEAYASEYFRVVDVALNDVMPNHMYMGARFASWGRTPEVVKAAMKYSDVMSYNEYKEAPHKTNWEFLKDVDMPSIIGEFHMGSLDTGLYHPGLVMATNQKDRGRMFKEYMETVIDNPYFIGAHWFQYIDSPITGRAYDGENYNVGFVSVTDTPYEEMVKAAQDLNTNLYTRRYGDLTTE